MSKTCFLLCTLLVLAAVVCSPVLATTYNSPLDPDKWIIDPDGICAYERTTDWWMETNGGDVEALSGVSPQGDPRIRQNIVNQSGDIWTDWHVSIVNGKNLKWISVYKVGENTPWVIEPPIGGGVGFFAHVISAGAGNLMAVNPQETLYVEFTYDVDVLGQPVTVTQYPTTWYPIPEPGSIMALLAGMGAFGLSAIRRIKK